MNDVLVGCGPFLRRCSHMGLGVRGESRGEVALHSASNHPVWKGEGITCRGNRLGMKNEHSDAIKRIKVLK